MNLDCMRGIEERRENGRGSGAGSGVCDEAPTETMYAIDEMPRCIFRIRGLAEYELICELHSACVV